MIARLAKNASIALALACAVGATGCYWSSQPQAPHRLTEFDLAAIPNLSMPSPRPLVGTRVIVLGRFDSTAPQPVGGLYDRKDYEVAPLYRTYFFKDGAVEIFEHVSDGLRASGLIVLKDYAGHAEPALLEAPIRARDPILVTATLTALQHDQINETNAAKFEAGKVEVEVHVTDSKGAVRLVKTYAVTGRIPYDGTTELLRLLGWKLAETLSADPAFVQAIAAQPRGQ